jgi:VIT1/CCC1 family predicted Fe2+/Mn2+ transporter
MTDSYKDEVAENFVSLVTGLLAVLPMDTETRQANVRMQHAAYARGQTNLVGLILGVTVAAIVGVGVAVPIINDVVSSANLTGTDALIAGFISTFLILLLLVAVASPLMNRM